IEDDQPRGEQPPRTALSFGNVSHLVPYPVRGRPARDEESVKPKYAARGRCAGARANLLCLAERKSAPAKGRNRAARMRCSAPNLFAARSWQDGTTSHRRQLEGQVWRLRQIQGQTATRGAQ